MTWQPEIRFFDYKKIGQMKRIHHAYIFSSTFKQIWQSLTKLREGKAMSTFRYGSHLGQLLLAKGIAHEIQLRLSSTLQYLYYLTQYGIATFFQVLRFRPHMNTEILT